MHRHRGIDLSSGNYQGGAPIWKSVLLSFTFVPISDAAAAATAKDTEQTENNVDSGTEKHNSVW